MDEEGEMSLDVINALFQQGFMAMGVGTVEGGSDISFTDSLLVIREISRVDPAVGLFLCSHNHLVLQAVCQHGTSEQKLNYLPKLCSDTVGCFCLSESSTSARAPFSVHCTATRDEEKGGFFLKGNKQYISNAKEAGVFLVIATTNPEKPEEGLSCFIVERETNGLTVGRNLNKTGVRATSTCEVSLQNVFVPESQVLGPLGGWKELTENILSGNKIAIAAQLLGLAEGAFDAAVPFLIEKENAEQKRLKDFQGIRFRAAELASEIESVRALVLAAALLRSRSLSVKKEAAIAKYKASLTAEKVASACIEFFGGLGCSKDFPAEKYLRDAKMGALYGGTNNLQMETIFDSIEEEYV
ncbi:short/branched chain specific acyl-CoA dehydrogenase, mitochondrial [Cyclospora cayetanensis]|uniref:Short/branched chain specific acyl-CoA dehydrogenase, mitochondrial n=1 Tax=Cyclospora cayetanensis TaxID=88456 RepID=A0A6P6RZX0_9EIME|nr:short/branched chain specific acyl-CoA dehydrogenase, mitochondrial [Cyclospora cayetanensis]